MNTQPIQPVPYGQARPTNSQKELELSKQLKEDAKHGHLANMFQAKVFQPEKRG